MSADRVSSSPQRITAEAVQRAIAATLTPSEEKPIKSVEDFIGKVFHTKDDAVDVFYRGHSDASFKLEPKLFRDPSYIENEHVLFRELQVLNAADFSSDRSTLDALVRMQHHSLPTRLLDITSNPLMALYFACKEFDEKVGQVVVLKIKRNKIKFYDSDTASCIANIAKLNYEYKDEIQAFFDMASSASERGYLVEIDKTIFNERGVIQMLLHFIREEKPYFLPVINPKDLTTVVCVRTKFNNSRISSQAGAFLLFGLNAVLSEDRTDDIEIQRIPIDAADKPRIRQQLDSLNINESTVFPHLENSAKYLAEKYKTKKPPVVSSTSAA